MFKIFPGFNLLKQYQKAKKLSKEDIKNDLKRLFLLTVVLVITGGLWTAPPDFFGIAGLTIVQQRVIAIFAFSTLMWLFEIIPSWATSVALITALLFATSDSALLPFREATLTQPLGDLLSSKEVIATFADPIVMLFIGGFILSIATSKSGLDVYMARVMLKPFGKKSENVLLGFILITGFFSMFISNTATAAMTLTFLTPIFKALPADGKGRIALTLAIPIAANIGGIATPIGTPPNAITLKYLNDPAGLNLNIGFGQWMAFMLPLALILLFFSWYMLKTLFPFKKKEIELEIKGDLKRDFKSYIVYFTFVLTILMWVFDKLTGVNANVVAMLPIAVFSVFGIITKEDLEEINWSVIWMVAGGFALGLALNQSGLAQQAVSAIPFHTWSPLVLLLASGLICYLLSNFISNTATAALLIPILMIVVSGMGESLNNIGGTSVILIGISIAASSAMLLPISTPPNALAHSTGLVNQKDMMKIGLIVGITTLVVGYFLLYILGTNHLI